MIKIPHDQDQKVIEMEKRVVLGASSKGKVLPVCYRCTQVPKDGLYDGFRVQGMFFCSDCQQELFSAEQGSPEYQEFLFLIKGIFY